MDQSRASSWDTPRLISHSMLLRSLNHAGIPAPWFLLHSMAASRKLGFRGMVIANGDMRLVGLELSGHMQYQASELIGIVSAPSVDSTEGDVDDVIGLGHSLMVPLTRQSGKKGRVPANPRTKRYCPSVPPLPGGSGVPR